MRRYKKAKKGKGTKKQKCKKCTHTGSKVDPLYTKT